MRKEKSCGVIPVFREYNTDFFLLIHQNNDLWAFPKGHVEEGEIELETASRELFEETGIQNIEFFPDSRIEESYYAHDRGDDYHKTVVYFVANVKDKNVVIQAEEVQDFKWLSFREAREQLTFENTRNTLEAAQKIVVESY